MISITLCGGLGNQMFMYATAKAMALRNHVPLALNIHSGFDNDFLFNRSFALQDFNLSFEQSRFRTFDYPGGSKLIHLALRLHRNPFFLRQRIFTQYGNGNSAAFLQELVTEPCSEAYLVGYWQNEKYFLDFEEEIRRDFQFKKNFSNDVLEELNGINSCEGTPVALGVRRYQECNYKTLRMDETYYHRAMDKMLETIPDAVFYAFSEVQSFVKEQIDNGKYRIKYIQPKQGHNSAIDDMMLFSSCQHHIISNSSFYWWGAWLSHPKVAHIVIAPKEWSDYSCSNWICI